ncbi:MAG: ATP synthase F1 subunit gamma [Marinifilaceae bacterium]|jgi:F-type H+-transporting ATPase subunit gamma|nr:ATP synthase F1 subunit gamma [Marinifilaceae bacterium]
MANLKEIRTRIVSVQKTKQVTSAMKMVSAAKLKKAQDAILQIRPYADKLNNILCDLSESLEGSENPYGEIRKEDKVLVVAISSNKGLCGAFNANVIKQVKNIVGGDYKSNQNKYDVFCIGKQANEILKKELNVIDCNISVFDDLSFETVEPIAEKIMESFITKKYDKVQIVYNRFKNAGVQILDTQQFLPIPLAEQNTTTNADYIYEPSKNQIIEELIPLSLKTEFYRCILDSLASEHGARMTAMHKATDNATELIKELNLNYNKARQSAITNEILEIVSGANALAQ